MVPSPILFIGEAPGVSEDLLGKPFCGPAGKLLDKIIERGIDGQWDYALTNLVACIPIDEEGNKTQEPSEEAIEACAPRLREFVRLCKPRLIVLVGKLAKKRTVGASQFRLDDKPLQPEWMDRNEFMWFTDIIHPAAILRMDISQRGLAIQRSIVAISDAIEEL
jgi:DNA polymerase